MFGYGFLPKIIIGNLLLAYGLLSNLLLAQPHSDIATTAWHSPSGNPQTFLFSNLNYTLRIDAANANATITSNQQTLSLPLLAKIGYVQMPHPLIGHGSLAGRQLVINVLTPNHMIWEQIKVLPYRTFFTVTLSGRLGPDLGASPMFFVANQSGFPFNWRQRVFSPDPATPNLPMVSLGIGHPFYPAPFELGFSHANAWVGIGLETIPDATTMFVNHAGNIVVNYPLPVLNRITNWGSGGTIVAPNRQFAPGTWLSFPSFVFVFGTSGMNQLRNYHNALVELGHAPSVNLPHNSPPAWWTQPIADTWGQQMATGYARAAIGYNRNWVLNFANSWRQRFGVAHFTLVIDSQWQSAIGSPIPSVRFGGIGGMRHLIHSLQAQGIKVLLWWPLWVKPAPPHVSNLLDPTSILQERIIAAQMQTLLGNAPNDLGANGLKLDWGSLTPPPNSPIYSRPQVGVGAAGLLYYLHCLSQAAWRVRPDALVEGSAMAPQFGDTQDMVRLYDDNSPAAWSYRAQIVSAVDPQWLIDGDGWRTLNAQQAIAHTIASTVFGVPAMYYNTVFSDEKPISLALAQGLGRVMMANRNNFDNSTRYTATGQWQSWRQHLVAETLNQNAGLATFQYNQAGQLVALKLINLVGGVTYLPDAPTPLTINVTASNGTSIPTTTSNLGTYINTQPGIWYTATFSMPLIPPPELQPF